MTYIAGEARQELLDTLGEATDDIAVALAALAEAYEQLGAPVQAAYGRAKGTYVGFARRHGLPDRTFTPAPPGLPSTGVRGFVDAAVASVGLKL